MSRLFSRRSFLQSGLAGTSLFLAGCQSNSGSGIDRLTTGSVSNSARNREVGKIAPAAQSPLSKFVYAARTDGKHVVAAVPYDNLPPRFRRQKVKNSTGMPPGSILIDPGSRFAYYITSNTEAIRYGIGVGKAGYEWSGDAKIGRKESWPQWTPPVEMLARSPKLAKYSTGMPGGPENPLGARALYLYARGRDTQYKLHGTPDWRSIGESVSSDGCILFLNQDIIDLFNRAPKGTPVRVI